ncbi:DddA-like double-stranded DNA deaminase toxin [Amycolatopsis sp. NPDC051716]|uniref:DddA-like double-stranded DNA deaminase toxin n=1 Tax=Amycolatopsis sp. NPDC051716 TaxID=3155804 RepID=UPI00342823B7
MRGRTVAIPRLNGRKLPAVESGGSVDDPVVKEAYQLLRRHGCTVQEAQFLRWHAEIKVAALMHRSAINAEVEIVINNTPCGTEQFRWHPNVCAKVLMRLFPPDSSMRLTVYGSYQNNRPYQRTFGRRRS